MKKGIAAAIIVLLLVAGVYLYLVLRPVHPTHGNLPPPTFPLMGKYISEVQEASAALVSATQSMLDTVGGVPYGVSATFEVYNKNVSDKAPLSLKPSVMVATDELARSLNSYADGVSQFDAVAQGWTTKSSLYAILDQKPNADGLSYGVLDPMAKMAAASGALGSFVSAWRSAYGRNPMASPMAQIIQSLSAAAEAFETQAVQGSSPYQNLAKDVSSKYEELFNYLVNPRA